MLMKHSLIGVTVAFALSAGSVLAGVSAAEAARLGSTLTPFGAEKAGNADGSIPEWAGGITQAPAGYKGHGQHHNDPFPNEQPLFTLTVSLADQGGQTQLDWHQAFDDPQLAANIWHIIQPSNEQNLNRLERALASKLSGG